MNARYDTPASSPGGTAPWPPPHPVLDAPYRSGPLPQTGAPSGSNPPGPYADSAGRRTRWLVALTAIAVAVAVIGGIVAYRFVLDQRYPDNWDPRIAPLAAFVEEATDLSFKHPVYVRFLADADFNELITDAPGRLTDTQREAIENEEALGRAFGWYTGSTDIAAEQEAVYGAGVLALYNFANQQIIVRSNDTNPAVLPVHLRVTIVHELFHALQDQRLDLRTLQRTVETAEAQQAFTALIEGHAVNIETSYLYSLSSSEQEEYFDYAERITSDIDDKTSDTAPALSVNLEAPYVIGPALVGAAQQDPDGVEQLYLKPPVAQDQVLDPRAYFADDQPETAAQPEVNGETLGSGTVGVVRLYLTLAAVLPPAEAWEAALTWGNDSYVLYRPEAGTGVCVSWNVYADSTIAAARLRTALTTWANGRDAAVRAAVSTTDNPVSVTMCDPGASVKQSLVPEDAVDYFYVRASVLTALVREAPDLDTAWCATDTLMRTETLAALQEPDDALRGRVREAVAAC